MGRRVKRTVTRANGSTQEKRYAWCGTRLCQMRGVLQPGNFEFVERVLFDEGEWTNGANRNLYLTDQIGSVRDVLDIGQQPVGSTKGNGKLVQATDYRPSGRIERQFVDSTSPATLMQYGQLQWDEDAGLYLSYTRAYDARIGRWLNRDPIREAGGVNVYGYVGGKPINYTDRLGLTIDDIYVARDLARETQPDLDFPDTYEVKDLDSIYGPETLAATRKGFPDTQLDDRYLDELTDPQAADLLNTIIHEGVHSKLQPQDPRQREDDQARKGYPYDQAKARTTKDLVKRFNDLRKRQSDKRKACDPSFGVF